MVRALVLDQQEGELTAEVRALEEGDLPEGDVLLEVRYSSLNYKDALAVTGKGKIIRGAYPFVPGIDLAGRVLASEAPSFQEGDLVVGTGWGLGEEHWGGYAQRMRVRSEWLVPLPEGLTPREAMAVGTAGFTAMLSVLALEEHGVVPGGRPVVVTGATGGVGSLAVVLLSALGYEVTAATGSRGAHDYLRRLGAAHLLDRSELEEGPARPMESAQWSGAVDVVGGATLAALIARLDRHGSVAACGLVGGHELHTTVFPFILRGVNLLGIDSNTCPQPRRIAAWQRLSEMLPRDLLEEMTEEIPLEAVPERSRQVLAGAVQGRLVVDVHR